jgi:hypothetical protein
MIKLRLSPVLTKILQSSVVAGLCFLYSACAVLGDKTVSVTEAQIQQKLNERLAIPFSLMKIFDVNLSNALVKFDQNTGRMHTTFDTQLSSQLFNESQTGKLGISGKLRFDAPTNSVVLDSPEIESFHLDGLDSKQAEVMKALAKQVGGQLLDGLTLYTVRPEDLKLGATLYQPKDMLVTDQGLKITLTPQQ